LAPLARTLLPIGARPMPEISRVPARPPGGLEGGDDAAAPPRFGEFLVAAGVLNRYQLLQALQVQDLSPSFRLGDCISALGFVPSAEIEVMHLRYAGGDSVSGKTRAAAATAGRPRASTRAETVG